MSELRIKLEMGTTERVIITEREISIEQNRHDGEGWVPGSIQFPKASDLRSLSAVLTAAATSLEAQER